MWLFALDKGLCLLRGIHLQLSALLSGGLDACSDFISWQFLLRPVLMMIYLLTAIGLSPSGSAHLHTNNTQNNTNNNQTTQIQANVEECGPCPVPASFTLAFGLQLRKKYGKTSVRVRKTPVRLRKTSVKVQYTYYEKYPHITKPSQTHTLQNPLIHTYAHTHTTKQYKTTTVQIRTKCI